MELKKLLVGLEGIKGKGNLDIEITGVESNSQKVKDGYIFVAIKGFTVDGHQYLENAVKAGATAVVVQEDCDLSLVKKLEDVTIIMVPNTRKALAIISSNFYGNPSKKLKLIGVTGTKGKTTTTFMIKEILEKAGKKVGLIGTIATYINGKHMGDSDRTTPESLELQKIFAKMVEEKVEYVVMEVSSQSLKLHRVEGCEFEIAIFTNLSEDHISEKEHPNMKDYFESKLKILEMSKKAYVNIDDLYGNKIPNIYEDKGKDITSYGIDNAGEILAKDITITNSYVDFKVKMGDKNERVKVGIPGRFSVYNSLAAICVARKLGIETETIKSALAEVRVPGRSELIDNDKELTIMIDYAHSPESLESILRACKSYTRGKVISVFGCGGDRDTRKRPVMGEISGRIADYTIITSDNPRTENPDTIVEEIEKGIQKTKGNYTTIVDRTKAIREALKMAHKNDIVILAGKGHETYQEINGEKFPYDERIIIKEILESFEETKK